jgi:hypothetical protein
MTNYYDIILNKEMLQTQFVELGKTSRQIAKEFKASRKVINYLLIEHGFITRSDIDPLVDLP